MCRNTSSLNANRRMTSGLNSSQKGGGENLSAPRFPDIRVHVLNNVTRAPFSKEIPGTRMRRLYLRRKRLSQREEGLKKKKGTGGILSYIWTFPCEWKKRPQKCRNHKPE